jgi:hypothetical protein
MTEQASFGKRPVWPYIVVALVLGLVVVGFFVIRDLIAYGRPAPEFPALADNPDTSLQGTVAYFASTYDEATQTGSGCVWIVAAAGAPSRQIDSLCFRDEDHLTGPQLAFLPDGRLEVTMFRWPTDQPLVVAWQRIVDVVTGDVEEVPAEQLPEAPVALDPGTGPAGAAVGATSEGGHAEIVVTDASGAARTLMSATVSPEYQIRATWGPGGEWILADDGRLLVVTLDDPAITRVLVSEHGGVGGYGSTDPLLVTFAVTDLNLLEPED